MASFRFAASPDNLSPSKPDQNRPREPDDPVPEPRVERRARAAGGDDTAQRPPLEDRRLALDAPPESMIALTPVFAARTIGMLVWEL